MSVCLSVCWFACFCFLHYDNNNALWFLTESVPDDGNIVPGQLKDLIFLECVVKVCFFYPSRACVVRKKTCNTKILGVSLSCLKMKCD